MQEKNLKKKSSVRQHFIPQFYLKKFGEKIHCYDKKKNMKIQSNSKNLAVKSDFYGGEFENLPSLEHEFAKFENIHAVSIAKLIKEKNYYKLNHEGKLGICDFLGFQYVRGDNSRIDIKNIVETALNEQYKNIIPKELKVTMEDDFYMAFQLKTIKHYRKFATFFFNMRFKILENNTSIPFWTSDNPLAKQNNYDKNPYCNLGITNRGIEFHIPLTPKLSLIALDPTIFFDEPEIDEIYKKKKILEENYLQVRSSNRFVYSNTPRFHTIKSILDKNPEFTKGNSKFKFFDGKVGNNRALILGERNHTWDEEGKIMGELDTWMPMDLITKIHNNKDLEL